MRVPAPKVTWVRSCRLAAGFNDRRGTYRRRDYCAPAPEGAIPTTSRVPPSSWISCLAPSRMLEASAILGSRWPGALFATKTPGIDVVLIAICPVLATTVPGAGLPFAAEGDPE